MVATTIHNGQMVYHDTMVAKLEDDKIVLNSGGYNTVTTAKRMNQFAEMFGLPYRVYRRQGSMFVSYLGQEFEFDGWHDIVLPQGE